MLRKKESGGLAVISPEAIQAGLDKLIVKFCKDRLFLSPTNIFHSQLGTAQVSQLYPHLSQNKLDKVKKLHSIGPSLVLYWDIIPYKYFLNFLKGAAHPAFSLKHTIRHEFPCDNQILNLIHCSDDSQTAAIEFDILNSCKIKGNQKKNVITSPHAHLGILNYIDLISEVFHYKIEDRIISKIKEQPQKNIRHVFTLLNNYANNCAEFRSVHENFFLGNFSPLLNFIDSNTLSKKIVFKNNLSRLAIESFADSAPMWLKEPIENVIDFIGNILNSLGVSTWEICGSTALWHYGIPIVPRDLDIRCKEKDLYKIANYFSKNIEFIDAGTHSSNVVSINIQGWDIEFTGDTHCRNNIHIILNDEDSKKKNNYFQSAVECAIEYLSMGRSDRAVSDQKVAQMLIEKQNIQISDLLDKAFKAGYKSDNNLSKIYSDCELKCKIN